MNRRAAVVQRTSPQLLITITFIDSNGEVKPEDATSDSNSCPPSTDTHYISMQGKGGGDEADDKRSPWLSRPVDKGDVVGTMTPQADGNSNGAVCEGDSEQ